MERDGSERNYLTRHITYRIPLIGRMAREVVEGDEENAFYAVLGGVSAWACLILLFGYPGLILPAIGLTLVMFLTLIRITLG
jgi:hypothetical protein